MFQTQSLPTVLPVTRIRMARTLFGRAVHEVSAYRIGDLLIDTGPPPTARRLVEWCRDAREDGPLSRVVLTHHHEDHVGGAAALQRELGLPVFAPASAVPILAEGLRMPIYRRMVWGSPRRFRPDHPLNPAIPLPSSKEGRGASSRPMGDGMAGMRGGDVVPVRLGEEELTFRVVPAPGHAFTHVCLWEAERRWLFSGDLFVHERVKYLRRIEDVWVHIESLHRVLALGPEVLICAHAGLVRDAGAAIERKIAWWEDLAEEAKALHDRGRSLRAITRCLLGREGFLFYASLGDFSKLNLVRNLLAGPGPERERGRVV